MKAVLLIRVTPTREKIVAKQLIEEIPEITDAWAVFGEFDVIATIETDKIETMSKIITNRIRNMKGIIKTATLISVPD